MEATRSELTGPDVEAIRTLFRKPCRNCRPKQATHYLYEVTAENGSMVGRVGVGNVLGEHRYYGKEHTWAVFDQKVWGVTGSYTGRFIGKASLTPPATEEELAAAKAHCRARAAQEA